MPLMPAQSLTLIADLVRTVLTQGQRAKLRS